MPAHGEDEGPWVWNGELKKFEREPPAVVERTMVRRARMSPPRSAMARSRLFFVRHRKAFAAVLPFVVLLVVLLANHFGLTSSPSVTFAVGPTSSSSGSGGGVAPPALPPALAPAPVRTTVAAAATTPDYFVEGVCLSGTIPDTEGIAVPAEDVVEVSCSSPAAHYKVVHTLPGTTDLNLCDQSRSPRTPYAFSQEYTEDGVPTEEYVYCLVAIR